MDPSAPAAQDVQAQTPAAQPATGVTNDQNTPQTASSDTSGQTVSSQPAPVAQIPPAPQPPKKQQISVSGGGLEEGASVVIEDPDADDEEDEIQVAPQEKKNLGVMGQGDAEDDEQQIVSPQSVSMPEEAVEVQPAVPEIVTGSPEVEKLVEITEPERPKISEELKNIGVTHSGPGIIDASQIAVPPAKIPITFEQVLTEEEKIKNNRLHSSKFWLLEKIKYLWRKVNPNIALTVKPAVKQTVAVNKLPVKANTAPVKKAIPANLVKTYQLKKQEGVIK